MKTRNKYRLFMGIYVLLLLILAMAACTDTASVPKPKAYLRANLPPTEYALSPDSLPFCFEVSNRAHFSWQQNKLREYFCDLTYPLFNARLYCTYHRIVPAQLREMADESHRMAYRHTVVASGITEKRYSNDSLRVYGLLYEIQGDAATPLQLALTDSLTYYFNASLYFNAVPNADSIAPVLDHIRCDVIRLMESFKSKPY